MNLLEHYIEEIHSEETHFIDGNEYVIADVTINSYGVIERTKHSDAKAQWEEQKKQGWYLA